MTEATATWTDHHRFVGESSSAHGIVVDGDKKTGNSPMELNTHRFVRVHGVRRGEHPEQETGTVYQP